VLAGAEHGGDGGDGDGRPLAAAAALEAVDHAAAGGGALAQVLVGLVDEFLGDDDTGVAGGAEGLDLGDRHRPLVEVVTVAGRDVPPAAPRRAGALGD